MTSCLAQNLIDVSQAADVALGICDFINNG